MVYVHIMATLGQTIMLRCSPLREDRLRGSLVDVWRSDSGYAREGPPTAIHSQPQYSSGTLPSGIRNAARTKSKLAEFVIYPAAAELLVGKTTELGVHRS